MIFIAENTRSASAVDTLNVNIISTTFNILVNEEGFVASRVEYAGNTEMPLVLKLLIWVLSPQNSSTIANLSSVVKSTSKCCTIASTSESPYV